MSDEKIKSLETENATLRKKIEQKEAGVNGLFAQLDAQRETMNESLNLSLQLRTNVFLLTKANQEAAVKISTLMKELDEAKNRIIQLEKGSENAPDKVSK